MTSQISIAVVTKDRPQMLGNCLKSIYAQTLKPRKIIILDNSEDKSAYQVCKDYVRDGRLIYFSEKKKNVPGARNTALEIATTRYLGFVDDDCVLDERWIEKASGVLSSNSKIIYVSGNTRLGNKENLLALSQYLRDKYWYVKTLGKNYRTKKEHFDTKNVVLNRELVVNKGLKFDTKCSDSGFDSADFEFGIQLNKNSLYGVYEPMMRLMHYEAENINRYYKRGFIRGRNAAYISKKWNMEGVLVDQSEKNVFLWFAKSVKKFPQDYKRYTKKLKAPVLKKLIIVILIRVYETAYLAGFSNYESTN